MAMAIFAIASIALSAISMKKQNDAIDDQTRAAAEQANLDVAELDRQRKQESLIAQEKKSDRAREADQKTASMVAALADVGGAGTVNESRFAGEIGFLEGLDIARIEGNRRRKVEALHSMQQRTITNALNIAGRADSQKQVNKINFLSEAFSIAGKSGAAGKAKANASGGTVSSKPAFSGYRFDLNDDL